MALLLCIDKKNICRKGWKQSGWKQSFRSVKAESVVPRASNSCLSYLLCRHNCLCSPSHPTKGEEAVLPTQRERQPPHSNGGSGWGGGSSGMDTGGPFIPFHIQFASPILVIILFERICNFETKFEFMVARVYQFRVF